MELTSHFTPNDNYMYHLLFLLRNCILTFSVCARACLCVFRTIFTTHGSYLHTRFELISTYNEYAF